MAAIQNGGVGREGLLEIGGADTSPSSATDSQDEILEDQENLQRR